MTKSGKYCGKRRNCTLCAISSFVTMFSKSRLLQRRPKVSMRERVKERGINCSDNYHPRVSSHQVHQFGISTNSNCGSSCCTNSRTEVHVCLSHSLFNIVRPQPESWVLSLFITVTCFVHGLLRY